MLKTKTATHTLCEPAQSKCTWTWHKSHLMQEFSNKKNGTQMEPPDQAPALTPTVRTPQCGHAVWGISLFKLFSGTTY